jgi:hypothetical protein
MSAGRHAAEFTIIVKGSIMIGLARETGVDLTRACVFQTAQFWGIGCNFGGLHHNGSTVDWPGQEGIKTGDVLGLLLDCDAGTLAMSKNGRLLGTVATGLTGTLCWAVSMQQGGMLMHPASVVRVRSVQPSVHI